MFYWTGVVQDPNQLGVEGGSRLRWVGLPPSDRHIEASSDEKADDLQDDRGHLTLRGRSVRNNPKQTCSVGRLRR